MAAVLTLSVKSARKSQWAAVAGAPQHRQQGSAAGAVTLIEYSDFQCPSCKAAQPYVKELLKNYPDEILLVFKHFPLDRHPYARLASIAAECAGQQKKFWPMHDFLFERQSTWEALKTVEEAAAAFGRYGQELGLEMNAFEECRKDPASDGAVKADVTEGDARQVDSTPTFFLNSYRLVGPGQLYREGARLVEVEIRNAKRNPKASK